MSTPTLDRDKPLPPDWWPDVEHLVTEDDTPVDNIYSEKQQKLLTEPLYTSWPGPGENRPFVALANVGIYYGVRKPPIVPDALFSLDVLEAENIFEKKNRSYLIWEFGKPPDVGIEVVSNLEGEELGRKKTVYAQIGLSYYVVWDPANLLGKGRLQVFGLREKTFVPMEKPWFPDAGLGMIIWHGTYAKKEEDWLRWHDKNGILIPTGEEQALLAEQERQRAEQAEHRAERLIAQIKALGLEPKNGEATEGK
jgi:Uma2 family endonuclease